MATLTNKQIRNTYKDLLKINSVSDNTGIDGTLRAVEDGDATASALQISTGGVKSTGTFEVTGASTLTGAVTSGLINGQTISSAANLTGTLAVTGTTTLAAVVATTGTFSGNITANGINPFLLLNATGGDHAQVRFLSNNVYKGGILKYTTDDIGVCSVAGKSFIISVDGGGTNAVTVQATTGNVGMGTTSPSYKLDVNGTLGVTGAATLSSTLAVTGNATVGSIIIGGTDAESTSYISTQSSSATFTTLKTITLSNYATIFLDIRVGGDIFEVGNQWIYGIYKINRGGGGPTITAFDEHQTSAYIRLIVDGNDVKFQYASDGTHTFSIAGIIRFNKGYSTASIS